MTKEISAVDFRHHHGAMLNQVQERLEQLADRLAAGFAGTPDEEGLAEAERAAAQVGSKRR